VQNPGIFALHWTLAYVARSAAAAERGAKLTLGKPEAELFIARMADLANTPGQSAP